MFEFNFTPHDISCETIGYPVMLCFGEEDKIDRGEYNSLLCSTSKGVLAEYAGIDRRSMKLALESLEKAGLVRQLKNRPAWRVMWKMGSD
jgi:DNA-binding MarR family transcriptional regulator